MDRYAQELKNYIISGSIEADHLVFQQSCHSVEEAAQAAQVKPEDFVKNICLIDADGNLIVAIVKGEDRVSTKRVGKALGIAPPKVATPEQIWLSQAIPVVAYLRSATRLVLNRPKSAGKGRGLYRRRVRQFFGPHRPGQANCRQQRYI